MSDHHDTSPADHDSSSMRDKVNAGLSLLERTYIPQVLKGLALTFRHFISPKTKGFTAQYPNKRKPLAKRFRGEHRLNRDSEGRPKCTACCLCMTACPAVCIHIEPKEAPWEDRERVPEVFTIDMLRCIYCGMCEEACPCDAIVMTNKIPRTYGSREEFIYTIDKLLDN